MVMQVMWGKIKKPLNPGGETSLSLLALMFRLVDGVFALRTVGYHALTSNR